ncbi:hypothetical protein SAY87_017227 [Trapa incisa]|uniref:Uncharacterized protein n=1 Tax=Trapa incisa TaxID=236973 RepID=A0AAN7L860_9MYRT|nr:hypothetical protein SAY87_017227 [Trapa incisa]
MPKPCSRLSCKMLKFILKAACTVATTSNSNDPTFHHRDLVAGSSPRSMGCSVVPTDGSFDKGEPTSPSVSCMGRVEKKKMKMKITMATTSVAAGAPPEASHRPNGDTPIPTMIVKLFRGRRGKRSQLHHALARGGGKKPAPYPDHLAARRRAVLVNLDWVARGITVVTTDSSSNNGSSTDREVETISSISSSLGEDVALQPKKEINLWKRRATIRPPMLRL